MAYRVILVESSPPMLENLSATLKQSRDFVLLSTYTSFNAALWQSGIYNPNLFLMDIDNADFLENLPAFVDIFPEAIILGTMSEWDARTAYKAQKMGVTGCIIKPFKAQEVLDSIQLYEQRGKSKPSQIITFFSPKGRSGRTTLAALLALEVAKKSKESVALIDADLQFGDLPIFFDLEPRRTVVDAVHDVKLLTPLSFAPYFHEITENLYLLSSPDRPEYAELVDANGLVEVIRMAGHIFRYLFIDLPAGFNPLSIAVSNFANTNFVVAMINTGLEVLHMKRSLDLLRSGENRKENHCPIFTRVNPCNGEQKAKLEEQLGFPVTAIFPNEYNLVSVANSGRILYGLPHDTLMMKTINKLSEEIIAEKL
ncbi:MAG: response regulator receiver protein [Selenomonadaceae bacterium]|nr:response regulator receiver protein [Selenomonadaceae bacterium]